jgi:hypothetical protein
VDRVIGPVVPGAVQGNVGERHIAYEAPTPPTCQAPSRAYDDVLNEVADRIRVTASIGKADIGALLFWKRLRADTPWVRELMVQPEEEVRKVTAMAVSAVTDTSLPVPLKRLLLGLRRSHRFLASKREMHSLQPFCWRRLPNEWRYTTSVPKQDWRL